MRTHLTRAPLVATVRVARTAGLFAPRQQRDFEAIESRNPHWQFVAWWCYVVMLPFAVYGLVLLLRRRTGAAAVLGALGAIAVASAISDGNQRLRMAVEPELLLAAATALVALRSRRRARRQPSTSEAATSSAPAAPSPQIVR